MKHESTNEKISFEIAGRPRRLRKTAAIRALVQETLLRPQYLVQPVFVTDGPTHAIENLPGVSSYQLADLLHEVEAIIASGVSSITLFCRALPTKKQSHGSDPFHASSLMARSLKALKSSFPELMVIADISLEGSHDHGHDGKTSDASCRALGKLALVACGAGADFISPSDTMDGSIGYLRNLLDEHDFASTGLISYAAQYASALHTSSVASAQDAKTHLLSFANARESLHECRLEEEEGVDMLLITPALTSLDIIAHLRADTLLPIGAFHSSGEWAMLQAAAMKGLIDRDAVLLESLMAIRRAGADFIFCYGAKEAANLLR